MREDQAKCGWNGVGIDCQNHNRRQDVERCHKWNQSPRHLRNPLNTAKKNRANKKGDDNSGIQMRNVKRGVQSVGDGVRLHHVADTKTGNTGKQRKCYGKPTPVGPHPILDVIHRSTDKIAVFILFTETDRADSLGIFCAHTNQRRHPHPEDGTRAAKGYGSCHTGNITCADGR